jgi:hypothetical protein
MARKTPTLDDMNEGCEIRTGRLPRLTLEQLEALIRYADEHGRTWKSQLNHEWMNGTCSGEVYRLRNTHGPSWLVSFSLRKAVKAF